MIPPHPHFFFFFLARQCRTSLESTPAWRRYDDSFSSHCFPSQFVSHKPSHYGSFCVSVRQRVKSRALEDVVILNVDTNTLESPYEDLKKIPADVVRLVYSSQVSDTQRLKVYGKHCFCRWRDWRSGWKDRRHRPGQGSLTLSSERRLCCLEDIEMPYKRLLWVTSV